MLLIKGITNQQVKLTAKRNNQVRDYLNKTAQFMVNHCIQNSIANLIVGYNPSVKQEINIGGCNNQNFVQIPFHTLPYKLKVMGERYVWIELSGARRILHLQSQCA
jgi:IS605 OrfB family transposase